MAYPPTPPPADRLNTTPQVTNHPADHNLISGNVSDIVNELGANPSGTYADVQARLDSIMPVGTILEYGSETPPIGNWLLCHGASLSTTGTYAALFAVLGYEFGGAGSAFNVPDFRDRSAIGLTAGGAGIGVEGGSKNVKAHVHPNALHVHSINQHRHTFSDTITNNLIRLTTQPPVVEGTTGPQLFMVTSNNNQPFFNGRMSSNGEAFQPMPTSPVGANNYRPAISTGVSVEYKSTVVSGNTNYQSLTTNQGPDGAGVNTGSTGDANDNYHPMLRVAKIIKY
jgi:microcystin-dependent protein